VRRIPSSSVKDLDEVAARIAAHPGPLTLIFDADNTLVPQGASSAEFEHRVNAVIDRFESMASVERVIILSNGPQRGADRVIGRGNKPWTNGRRLGLARRSATPIWVIGDQVITDGVLAWRLGAEFFLLAIDPADDYPGQARMRRLGRYVAPLIFRRKGLSDPPDHIGRRPR
jgi:predicted HAD superfamily phosphohydrolase YqeG